MSEPSTADALRRERCAKRVIGLAVAAAMAGFMAGFVGVWEAGGSIALRAAGVLVFIASFVACEFVLFGFAAVLYRSVPTKFPPWPAVVLGGAAGTVGVLAKGTTTVLTVSGCTILASGFVLLRAYRLTQQQP